MCVRGGMSPKCCFVRGFYFKLARFANKADCGEYCVIAASKVKNFDQILSS
jgi:hypothetical protein